MLTPGGFTYRTIYLLKPPSKQADLLSFSVTPSSQTNFTKYRNINLSNIDYAFRPRLSIRLTQGGFTLPWNP